MTTIEIGFTKTDRPGNYIPMCDGYRAGAEQEVLTLAVSNCSQLTPEQVAEAVFEATNAPDDVDVTDAAHHIRWELRGRAYRSLSVGDTVAVAGVKVECKRVGWGRIQSA